MILHTIWLSKVFIGFDPTKCFLSKFDQYMLYKTQNIFFKYKTSSKLLYQNLSMIKIAPKAVIRYLGRIDKDDLLGD